MANKKKVILEPAGKDLKQFQSKYALAWKKIVESPAYQAGVQFLRNRKLERVALLSEADIEKNSREHLADLRGYLRHEVELGNLSDEIDFSAPLEEQDEYISPEQQAEQEQLMQKFREETKKQRYATS